MDLLFSRYASPFVLLDTLILTNSTSDFISDMFKFINEEKEEKAQWEFFLHKVYEKSWKEFIDEIHMSNGQNEIDLGATLNKSKNMLKNFTPESEV